MRGWRQSGATDSPCLQPFRIKTNGNIGILTSHGPRAAPFSFTSREKGAASHETKRRNYSFSVAICAMKRWEKAISCSQRAEVVDAEAALPKATPAVSVSMAIRTDPPVANKTDPPVIVS